MCKSCKAAMGKLLDDNIYIYYSYIIYVSFVESCFLINSVICSVLTMTALVRLTAESPRFKHILYFLANGFCHHSVSLYFGPVYYDQQRSSAWKVCVVI